MATVTAPSPILLVASDMDGTLLNAAHEIDPFTKDILFRVVTERRVPFVFATGRHHLSVRAVRDDLVAYWAERRAQRDGADANAATANETGFFLVSSNGARIHDDAGRLVAEHNLPADVVRALFNDFGLPYTHKRYAGPTGSPVSPLPNTPVVRNAAGQFVPVGESAAPMPVERLASAASEDDAGVDRNDEDPEEVVTTSAYTTDDWYLTAPFLSPEAMMKKFGFLPRTVPFDRFAEANKGRSVFDEFPLDGVGKVCFRCSNTKILAYIERTIKERFGDRVSVALSSNYCLDVMAAGVSKATALRDIAERLTQERAQSGKGQICTMTNIIAFGDSMNDKEMLRMVGRGCLMANAQPRLKKELPQCEVIGHHEDHGVAKKLKEVFQLE